MTLTDDHLPTIQEATHSRSTEKRKLEDLSSIAVSSIDNNTIFDGTFSLPEKPQRPNTVAAASSSSGNKISQDIAQYLETIYAQHSVPPEWILSTLQKHLDIDIKRLRIWFRRKQQREHRLKHKKGSNQSIDNVAGETETFKAYETSSSPGCEGGVGDFDPTDGVSLETGDFAPTTRPPSRVSSLSLEFIHKLVSNKQADDLNALMLHKYGHSLQYLVMTLFSHEANVSSGLVDLDRQVRNQSELVSLYGEVAAELIQVLYYRVCDLEGHLIYNSIDEYERDNKIRRLSNHSQSDNGIIDTEKPCSSNVVEPVEPSVEEWRAWQRQMCMIDSNELYAQNGVVIDTSCIGTNPNNYYFLSATEDSLLNIADSEVGISNNNSSRNSNESHPSSRPASMKASAPTTGRVSPVGSHSNIHSPPIALEGFSAHELDALVRCIESVDNRQYVRPHQLPSISTSILSSSAYHDMMPATTIPTFSQQHLQQPQLQKHNLNQHVYNHQQPPLLPAYYQPQQYFPQLQQSQQQQTQYSHHPYVQPQTLAHPNLMMANYSGDVGSRDLFGAAGLETALFAE